MSPETQVATLAPASLETLITQIAQSDAITPEKVEVIERLVALMERREAQQRKERFFEALARVQALVPRVKQNGLMDRGPGKGQIPYAKREDIDAMVRPLYLAEGFSVTWDAPELPGGKIQVIGRFTCGGHTEAREWSCAPDPSGGKTGPQASSSTLAYGKRQISKMFWDVIEEGLDKNGAGKPPELITQDQADTIRTRMNDLPQRTPGLLLDAVCRKYGVKRPEDIAVSQLNDVLVTVADSEGLAARKAEKK